MHEFEFPLLPAGLFRSAGWEFQNRQTRLDKVLSGNPLMYTIIGNSSGGGSVCLKKC